MSGPEREIEVVEAEPCYLCDERMGVIPGRSKNGKLILRCRGCNEVVGWEVDGELKEAENNAIPS